MTSFDIRASDKGPGRARPPRTKTPRSGGGGGSSGGEKKSGWPCLFIIAPPLVLFLFSVGLFWHGP